MNLSMPTVGPIVGYTTANQTRIFVRGGEESGDEGMRRCFAALRWKPAAGGDWSKPIYNKLSPNFDMTGVLVLNGLAPDTEYEYAVGWFHADADLENVQKIPDKLLKWPGLTSRFRTSSGDNKAKRSYVVGSCRYLLQLLGGSMFDDRGDKTFRSILGQIEQGRRVDGLLMIGDQIYADDLGVVAPDTRLEHFLKRYRTVFAQPFIRQLMAHVPTYMMLDDHEIEDNWPSKATEKDRLTLYPHAIHAYQIYQCSHSPLFTANKEGRIDGTLSHFWYQFADGCADWFVMDTRTERVVGDDGNGAERRLINEEQRRALFKWLADGSGRVKLVVSSVPLFPDLSRDSDDKWGAFPEERAAVLEHIRKNAIRKVVFVSGDVHCSFASRLTLDGDPAFAVHSIVSSSFFWPYPHTEQSDFRFDQPPSGTGANGKYLAKRLTKVYSTDNFARIDVRPSEVDVTYFERKGDQLGSTVTLTL